MITHKICNKCKRELSVDKFSKHGGANYFRPECKECNNKLSKIRKQIKEQYGMPPKGYCCPICNGTEEEVKGKGGINCSTWVVDHDHKTNKFRGWLCHACNRGVGCFHDDIEYLKRAINYLEVKI